MNKRRDYSREPLTVDSIAWWGIANLAVLAFAVASWAGCYYVFTFPEKPFNYKLLEKIGRIGEIEAYTPLDAPAARSAASEDLYELFYSLDEDKTSKFNEILKRGYITNYEKIPVYRYLQGEFRILGARSLDENDFISPGVLVKARAFVKADEHAVSSPYPLVIDFVLPTRKQGALENFQDGDLLELSKKLHCASIINVKKEGRAEDPTLRCVVIPLAYNVYNEIPLDAPEHINVSAPFPMFDRAEKPTEE